MAGNFTAATGADFHYRGTTDGGAPSTGQFVLGDWVETPTGIALCRIGGTPGTWSDFSFTPTGATVPVLPASNGSDDTTTLNAVLAGWGRFRGKPGENYLISAPLVLPSNTELDMTGCTVTLIAGSNTRMLRNQNALAAALRTVADAAITTGTAILTSATAAFTAADKGRAVSVAGATSAGSILNARIQSVTNATTVVLSVNAGSTVSGASLSVYAVDQNITVIGGTWDKGANSGSSNNELHITSFHRVTNLKLLGLKFTSTNGKEAILLADVDGFVVRDIVVDVASAGVQAQGPAAHGLIANIYGTTGDDFVALGCRDYIGYEYSNGGGDIYDVTVRDLLCASSLKSICHLFGGVGTKMRDVTVDTVRGTTSTTGVACTDDTANANTTGMDLDGIVIRNVHCTVGAGYAQVSLGGVGFGRVTVDNYKVTQTVGATTGVLIGATYSGDAVAALNGQVGSTVLHNGVYVVAGAVLKSLLVDGIRGIGSGPRAVRLSAAPTITTICNVDVDGIANFIFSDLAVAAQIILANISVKSMPNPVLLSGNGAISITASNLLGNAVGNGFFAQNSASGSLNLIIEGYRVVASAPLLYRSASQVARVNGRTALVDAVTLTPTIGDVVYNTNAALAAGVGLVLYNGTAWVLANTGAVKTGTAVLVAGTVVVADTAITANSIIRLTAKTLGGTAGALFVSARTAATSFAITSTNAADTSTVQYEILAY